MPAERIDPVYQGDGFSRTVQLRRTDGTEITSVYAGTETLAAEVWPGDDLAVSFAPTVAWISGTAGTIRVSGTGAQTGALAAGEYRGRVLITDGGQTYTCYEFALPILAKAGTGVAPAVYCTLDDLHRYGRHALLELQDENDQAGWREQRAEARQWFEDILHACDVTSRRSVRSSPLLWTSVGTLGTRGRNPWLVTQLAADKLIVTRPIREAVACYALSLVLAARPELAGEYRMRANELAKTIVAELDTNADGVGDYVIDCTAAGR